MLVSFVHVLCVYIVSPEDLLSFHCRCVLPGCLFRTDVTEVRKGLSWSLIYWSRFFKLIGDDTDISQIL